MKITLKIPCEGTKLDRVKAAEGWLRAAGVTFDTGYDFVNKVRDWELDESLEGAEVVIKGAGEKE